MTSVAAAYHVCGYHCFSCHIYYVCACVLAVSCVVSEWSVWSGCLEPCKPTLRTRRRQVIQEARNGGKPCPPLQQTAGCAEYHDQDGPCLQSLGMAN